MLAAHADRLDRALTATLAGLASPDIDVVAQARALMCHATVDFCISADHQDADNADLAAAAAAASAAQLAVLDSVAPALAWLPNRVLRRSRTADQQLRAAVTDRVTRRERAGSRRDLLDVLLAHDDLTRADITGIVHLALLASYGLPGTALAWVIREMGLRPEVADQIRAEAPRYAEALATGSPDALPYTQAVVKETLRLYPPAWLMVRQVRAAISLARWQLTGGQEVLLVPYLIHRDPRWWPDPDSFRPERWLAGDGNPAPSRQRHAYLPFGSGPTMCLGHRLGSLQLVLAAARIADSFQIQLLNPGDATPAFSSALSPAGLRMQLTPRSAGPD
jgi:enediyne biosynthesis protein E7